MKHTHVACPRLGHCRGPKGIPEELKNRLVFAPDLQFLYQ